MTLFMIFFIHAKTGTQKQISEYFCLYTLTLVCMVISYSRLEVKYYRYYIPLSTANDSLYYNAEFKETKRKKHKGHILK